jgi:hypothetical protein
MGARNLVAVRRLLVREEQLGGRDLGSQTAILASRLHGERRSGRGCVRGALHLHYCRLVSAVPSNVCMQILPCAALRDVPSGSEPAIELLPLQLWPRVFAYMAEPIEYSDEKDRRLFSAASTSVRGDRNASGSINAFTGARLARVPSSVGVVSVSSIAEPLLMLLLGTLLACPKNSRMLSDALDSRRWGICRIATEPDGGSETLALPTMSPPVSGSLDLAFLSAGEDPLAAVSCCHDCVLSTLTVRDSVGSMSTSTPECRRWVYVQKLLLRQASAI